MGSKVGGHDFVAGPRDQGADDADRHVVGEKSRRAVGHGDHGAVGMEAVDFVVVGAIDGAGPGFADAVAGEAVGDVLIVAVRPAAAAEGAGDQSADAVAIRPPASSAITSVLDVPSVMWATLHRKFTFATPSLLATLATSPNGNRPDVLIALSTP